MNSFETLRLLRARFGTTKRQTMTSTQMCIVLQQFDWNRFIEQRSKWEFDISEHEGVTTDRRSQVLKMTILSAKTNGDMYRDLCMQANDFVN